jgi:hypothetical protein
MLSPTAKRSPRRIIVVIAVRQQIVDLLGSLLSPERTAKAVAVAPGIVDQ